MPATTTTKSTTAKPNRVTCPDCKRSWTQRQLEAAADKGKPIFHRNKNSRTGWQTWCREDCKRRDAAKKATAK